MRKLFALFAIILAFIVIYYSVNRQPEYIKIENSIMVYKSVDKIFPYLKLLENGKKWMIWSGADFNTTKIIRGVDGNVGAAVSWKGKYNNTTQEIKSITKDTITFEFSYELANYSNEAYIITEYVTENATRVTIGVKGKSSSVFNEIYNNSQASFLTSINRMKKVLESQSEEQTTQAAELKNVDSEVKEEDVESVDDAPSKEDLENQEQYSLNDINPKSDLARSYSLKILPVIKESFDDDHIWIKYDVTNLKNEFIFLLTSSGETVEMVYEKRKFMKIMSDKAYYYSLVNKSDKNKKVSGEFIIIGKKEIANDVKFYPGKRINDVELPDSIKKMVKAKYGKADTAAMSYTLKDFKKSYQIFSIEFGMPSTRASCLISGIFIRDNEEKKVFNSSFTESECKDGYEGDLVTTPEADMPIFGDVNGILSIKGEDWVIFDSHSMESSGFTAARYISEGRFDFKSALINHYNYYGNL